MRRLLWLQEQLQKKQNSRHLLQNRLPKKKAPAKKTSNKKSKQKKLQQLKRTAVRKTSSRKTVSLNTEVYVQWLGKEVYERDIIENIKKVWTEEMGKKESELVDLKIYIKPEDNGAHYVINGDITDLSNYNLILQTYKNR